MPSTRAALWRDRSLRFALGGGAPLVTAIFAVVRNKWLAEHLATAGLGVLGQVFSSQTLLGTAAGLGLSLPVARAVGAATGAGDMAEARRTAWTALLLAGGAALAVALAGLAAAPWISQALLGTIAHAGLVRIAMLGVAGLALHAVASGLFAGRSDVGGPLAVALGGGIVAVAATIALVPRAGLTGGAIGAAVLVPAGLVTALVARRRVIGPLVSPAPAPRFDPAACRALLGVGVAALVLAVCDQGTLLTLRAHYLRAHGIPANGLFQAALALAQQVSGVFTAYLAGYAFGRVSGAAGAERVRDYTRRHWLPLMALAAAAFALAMVLAAPLIALLYSDRFLAARPLMAWTLFAEFCRVMTQVWALGALPLGGVALWMAIGLAGPLVLVAAYAWLAPHAGLLALPQACALAGLAQLAVAGVLMSRRGVSLSARDGALLAAALAALALLARAVAGGGLLARPG